MTNPRTSSSDFGDTLLVVKLGGGEMNCGGRNKHPPRLATYRQIYFPETYGSNYNFRSSCCNNQHGDKRQEGGHPMWKLATTTTTIGNGRLLYGSGIGGGMHIISPLFDILQSKWWFIEMIKMMSSYRWVVQVTRGCVEILELALGAINWHSPRSIYLGRSVKKLKPSFDLPFWHSPQLH